MSEMLGNQYFMARNYVNAEKELEPEYLKDTENKGVRRKLIICYIQTRKFDKALDLFHDLVREDVNFLAEADSILDDCPCSELLNDFTKKHNFADNFEYNLSHGMLWLYCEGSKSLKYLKLAQTENPSDERISESIGIIEEHLKHRLTN